MSDARKQYTAPDLAVYGRLEEMTMFWSNPTSTDNTCPGPSFLGNNNPNSGSLCLGGGPPGEPDSTGSALPVDLILVDPELAAELSGMPSPLTGDGS